MNALPMEMTRKIIVDMADEAAADAASVTRRLVFFAGADAPFSGVVFGLARFDKTAVSRTVVKVGWPPWTKTVLHHDAED